MTVRWSEEEYQQWIRQWTRAERLPLQNSEAVWLATIRHLAKYNGYMYYHTFDSRRSPSGFPDVVLAKAGSPLLCVELKTDTGQVTQAQQAWLAALAGCTGVVSDIWRPSALDAIVQRLRGATP